MRTKLLPVNQHIDSYIFVRALEQKRRGAARQSICKDRRDPVQGARQGKPEGVGVRLGPKGHGRNRAKFWRALGFPNVVRARAKLAENRRARQPAADEELRAREIASMLDALGR
jgi:hypothetical protein